MIKTEKNKTAKKILGMAVIAAALVAYGFMVYWMLFMPPLSPLIPSIQVWEVLMLFGLALSFAGFIMTMIEALILNENKRNLAGNILIATGIIFALLSGLFL